VALAAEWLTGQFGADLSSTVVALPGSRAGRLLVERLGQVQPSDWQPPTIVTTGQLTDEFLHLDSPSAARLVRTLSWEQALRKLSDSELGALVSRPPEVHESAAWRRLASEVRGVFATLSAEGLDFATVSEKAMGSRSRGEQRRWEALCKAQALAEDYLAKAELCDPHRGRLAALKRGDLIDPERPVVLVGVVDAIGLVRQLVRALGQAEGSVHALVFAPEECSDAFDDMGCLEPDAWLERLWTPPLESWRVALGPEDQSKQVVHSIGRWKGKYSAEQITVGVADREVAPFLERAFQEQDVFARDAEGTGLGSTSPARLLSGIASFLGRGRFADLAGLVRHPDLETYLCAGLDLEGSAPGELFDEYHNDHLPGPQPRPWLRAPDGHKVRHSELSQQLGEAVQEWLVPLGGSPRSLSEWAGPVRDVLGAVYGEREFDLSHPGERLLQAGLKGLAKGLEHISELPDSANPEVGAAEALEILLGEIAAERVPPRAAAAGEAAVELLGWLELAMDEAPALVLTGFNEGFMPEAVQGDGWLPDGLRQELGLPDDRGRLARDLYTLEWLMNSREEFVLISGRRTLDGDPLRPSRLAFHGSPQQALEGVRHFLSKEEGEVSDAVTPLGRAKLKTPPLLTPPSFWSASAFSEYLGSPYVFCLRRLAGLRTLDDRDQEMGPMLFGIIGHEVLNQFGQSDLITSTDPKAIAGFLNEALISECSKRFGRAPLPAVQLQSRQLAYRLDLFARRQAARTADGWHIEKVEWAPSEPVSLDVDGEAAALVGRIDRIDQHEDGRWAILDYKFGEKAKYPKTEHLRWGEWVNVQLPLYALLAREVIGEAHPELGYFNLAATDSDSGVQLAKEFDGATLDAALDTARQVVREVREQLSSDAPEFALGQPKIFDPILADLCGQGLLSLDAEEEEE
jgi:ATP-dependent helicase/nuclease subunit B